MPVACPRLVWTLNTSDNPPNAAWAAEMGSRSLRNHIIQSLVRFDVSRSTLTRSTDRLFKLASNHVHKTPSSFLAEVPVCGWRERGPSMSLVCPAAIKAATSSCSIVIMLKSVQNLS